jgi:hypothetical protein
MINETRKYSQKGKEYVQQMPADRLAKGTVNYSPRGQRNPQKSYDKMQGLIMVRSGNIAPKSCEEKKK